ncbi:MAG: ATP-binding protein [Desulfobacterales bacterium]
MKNQVILCVDDEMVVLTSLKDQLRRYFGSQYRIEMAESGEEALEVIEELQNEGFEMPIIITDQIMPGMKGDELLTAVHERFPKALKIFLTGQADAQAVGNAVNSANLYRYLSKPWDDEDLRLTITTALQSYNQDKQLAEKNSLLEKLYAVARQEIEERKRVEALLAETNQNLEIKVSERTQDLSSALEELKRTQNQLIMQEKMASLGRLSAGIAHEIKNPLNLINGFAALNLDRTTELKELVEAEKNAISSKTYNDIFDLLNDLVSNAINILEEGQRSDKIIRSMLFHARDSTSEFQPQNINELLQDAVNLAYHAMRCKDSFFSVTIETDFDDRISSSMVMPQALNQVFVNLINNAYDALSEKKALSDNKFLPHIKVSTHNALDYFEIRIKDNGGGIGDKHVGKIFDPFYTTKAPGKGTGLGLSICHDIICRGHGGKIHVSSKEGQFTEIIIKLPIKGITENSPN